jgi:hypothetical protein
MFKEKIKETYDKIALTGDSDCCSEECCSPNTSLDKPGAPLFLSGCQGYCYKDAGVWSFTGWKVPKGSDFKVCVWNQESGLDNCHWGRANSRSESIHVKAP